MHKQSMQFDPRQYISNNTSVNKMVEHKKGQNALTQRNLHVKNVPSYKGNVKS